MKSRISFCNPAIIRKDVTRFAPLWAIYLIGGLLVMMTMLSGRPSSDAAMDLAETIAPFSVINLIYGVLCAQMLFGDLFNTRLCNALHALPLRRETWFGSHLVSGLLFSLVPHLIATVLMADILQDQWFVGLIWMLGMTLEYLCFFGIAVFSVFCTGNRFAMAAVYSIINFASMIVYWFIKTIYEPMLYGVSVPLDSLLIFCPVAQMYGNSRLVLFKEAVRPDGTGTEYLLQGLGEGWWYLAVCALLGVVLMGCALLMYRRRRLECAGDFIAVKPLEPVFAVVFTICVGCVFAMVEQLFMDSYLVFLCAGLIIGWFVSQMLLQRTAKVFRGKAFLKLAILLLALGASILLTWLDPLGITRWVPEADAVNVVHVDLGTTVYEDSRDCLALREEEEIRKVIAAHEDMLADRNRSENARHIAIRYTMKDGRVVNRTYLMYGHSEAWSIVESLYSTPQQILGYTDWESFAADTEILFNGSELLEICKYYDNYLAEDKNSYVERYDAIKRSLLEAMKKDCEEGLLTQSLGGDKAETKWWIELETRGEWYNKYRSIAVNGKSRNTLAWMEEYKHIMVHFVPEAYQ